jgi:hypothetical protein
MKLPALDVCLMQIKISLKVDHWVADGEAAEILRYCNANLVWCMVDIFPRISLHLPLSSGYGCKLM